jgi:hypothetical protein
MTAQALVWTLVGIALVLFVIIDVSLTFSRRRKERSAAVQGNGDVTTRITELELVPPPPPPPELLPAAVAFESPAPESDAELELAPVGAVLPLMGNGNGNGASALADDGAAEGAGWATDYHAAVGELNVPARSTFLSVLESVGTPRAVAAIARAAVNDPDVTIRAESLKGLARLIEDDGEVWADIAAQAARAVIAQRAKGGDDVARARDLLATVDVVLYES